MLTENEIINQLDATYSFGDYYQFIQLGHPYSYLIDARLNIFTGENDNWAIVAERLGFNDRAGEIELEIFYYGNCLCNLVEYNGQQTNYYSVKKIDSESFFSTTDGFDLLPEAKCWHVGHQTIGLSTDREIYNANDIKLKEYEPGKISIEEAARLANLKYSQLFRASDAELYKSLPTGLKKILVIDEWYHKDFLEMKFPLTSDEHLKYVYELNKNLGSTLDDVDFQTFEVDFRNHEKRNVANNKRKKNKTRPGSYETWKLIAKVIATGDTSLYQPTISANSNWKNWPLSGSL